MGRELRAVVGIFVVLMVLVGLLLTLPASAADVVAAAAPVALTGETPVLPTSEVQLACAQCGLATAIGARLGETTIEISDEEGAVPSRWEAGPVAAVSPTVTGTGAAVSYRWTPMEKKMALWGDLGALRWESDTDGFVGVSTNVPIGGQTIKENTAIGGGWLFRAQQLFAYTRVRLLKF